MHFKSLQLENFRGFCSTDEIPLAPLTFLVGPNSSGKSSLFDALLLISQSGFAPANLTAYQPNWQGPLVDLGSFRDAVYRHEITRKIHIAISVSADANEPRMVSFGTAPFQEMRMAFELSCTGRADPVGFLSSLILKDSDSSETLTFRHPPRDLSKAAVEFLGRSRTRRLDPASAFYNRRWLEGYIRQVAKAKRNHSGAMERFLFYCTMPMFNIFVSRIQRVSSGRLGPKRWYPATGLPASRTPRALYDTIEPPMLEEIKRQEERDKKGTKRNRQRVARILKDLDIASAIADLKLSPYHTAINVRDNITGVKSNLIDVGYGASQVMPVILGCLNRMSWSPLLVEQPEIHLHPRAQGRVAELLCTTSKRRQVIIETHSEHMINRARILVAQGKLDCENVIINYVSRDKRGSRLLTIPILRNGDFGAEWPKGFFDERYQDTMLLLDIKQRFEKRKHK